MTSTNTKFRKHLDIYTLILDILAGKSEHITTYDALYIHILQSITNDSDLRYSSLEQTP